MREQVLGQRVKGKAGSQGFPETPLGKGLSCRNPSRAKGDSFQAESKMARWRAMISSKEDQQKGDAMQSPLKWWEHCRGLIRLVGLGLLGVVSLSCTSFDLCSIVYRMTGDYCWVDGGSPTQEASACLHWVADLLRSDSLRVSLFVVDDSRPIFDSTEKHGALAKLFKDLSGLVTSQGQQLIPGPAVGF